MPSVTTAQIAEHAARLLATQRDLAERYLAAAKTEPGVAKNCDRASVMGALSDSAHVVSMALASLCRYEAGDTATAALIEADANATSTAIGHAASECRILALPPESQSNVREAMRRAQAESTQPAQVPA